jgi:nuclease S1
MPIPRLTLLFCLALLPAAAAQAWSDLGHRVVAELAERQLAPATRERALALLATEGRRSLADVASWADEARELPQYAWSRRMHFVNLPPDCEFVAVRDCPEGDCIVAAITRFRGELADPERTDAARTEALKFLVHFVGDIHQPLHAGFAHDLGGNRHQVSVDGRGSNLHSVWDRDIPAQRGLGHAAYADAIGGTAAEAGDDDPARWAMQSCALIDAHALYPPTRRIGSDYLARHLPLADAQMRLAGARLARAIEQALGN